MLENQRCFEIPLPTHQCGEADTEDSSVHVDHSDRALVGGNLYVQEDVQEIEFHPVLDLDDRSYHHKEAEGTLPSQEVFLVTNPTSHVVDRFTRFLSEGGG